MRTKFDAETAISGTSLEPSGLPARPMVKTTGTKTGLEETMTLTLKLSIAIAILAEVYRIWRSHRVAARVPAAR